MNVFFRGFEKVYLILAALNNLLTLQEYCSINYVTIPPRALSHWWRVSLNKTALNHLGKFETDPRVTRSLIEKLGSKARSNVWWGWLFDVSCVDKAYTKDNKGHSTELWRSSPATQAFYYFFYFSDIIRFVLLRKLFKKIQIFPPTVTMQHFVARPEITAGHKTGFTG